MFNNIYQGRRVLITGHTGFQGSWIATWLVLLGADVAGFSAQAIANPYNDLNINLSNKINDFKGDIVDKLELQKIMHEFKPEIVFHLAAQHYTPQLDISPIKTFEANILGTLHTLEAVRQCPSVKVIICVTGDNCYRDNSWIYAYREEDNLGGKDTNSASKACMEHISQAYFASFFKDKIACATVRAGNIMGGDDWAKDSLIANCARAWATNEAISLSNTEIIYPWIYVLEPLSGYLYLGAKLFQSMQEFPELSGQVTLDSSIQALSNLSGQAYNFGSTGHESNTVAEVLKLLSLHWTGFKSAVKDKEKFNAQENPIFKLCTDKALTKLHWRAVLDFEETIRYTAEWYSAYYSKINANDKKDMFSYTIGQISAYTNAADNRGLLWAR